MFNRKKMHNLLSPLIASNTVSADAAAQDISNRDYCEILANYLENLNFQCQIHPVPNSHNKWNLIAHRPGLASQSGGLMFSGHCDTVPAVLNQWHQDPWQLQQQENSFSGLGVTDMKGFFAAVITLLQHYPTAGRFPVTVIATADEETSMAGARAIRAADLRSPVLNIIGEPTAMSPIISHKGYLGFRVRLTSSGGHSSLNATERNCIDALHAVIGQLMQWRHQLQLKRNESFDVPITTLNFGSIRAGDAVNRICADAELELDIRPLPGSNHDELTTELESRIKAALAGYTVNYQLEQLYPPVAGFQSSLSSELLEHLSHCCPESPTTANYVTEAPFFEQQGCTSVVLGPGDINQAHTPNEWVSFDQLQQALTVYERLLHRFSVSERAY